MTYKVKRWMYITIGITAVALSVLGSNVQAAGDTARNGDKTIVLGWTAWADAEFVTKLAKQLIENRTGHHVELKMAAIGVQYKGVASGDLDGMMMAWLPDSQAMYWQRVHDQVDDLGTIYDGAQLGWVVPDYIPEDKLSSISDLHKPAVRQKLKGRIQGIDPGAGIMQLSQKAMKAYDLKGDYNLVPASGAAMTAALARAEKRDEWIVVTGWTPHWMFGKWHLRFLTDPKGALGKPQRVDVLVRKGFSNDYPQVANMLGNMYIPLDQLQTAMYSARNTSYKKAVENFISQHQSQIDNWFSDSDTDHARSQNDSGG